MKESEKLSLKENGFVHIKNLIPKKYIDYLIRKVNEELTSNDDEYAAKLSKLSYDFLNDDETILELINTSDFQSTLGGLTERNLLFLQGIGLEIRQKYDSGFPWHVEKGSFTYHALEDYGCTLWIPLCEINTKKQHGGMAYVPKNVFSGEFIYKLFQGTFKYLSSETEIDVARKKYYDMNRLEVLQEFLEFYKVEHDFSLGDALLFDKDVFHRSNMLHEGPLEKRSAFIMRFIDINSRYDEKRVKNYDSINKVAGVKSNSKLHENLNLKDKDLIIKSDLFKDCLNTKIISG